MARAVEDWDTENPPSDDLRWQAKTTAISFRDHWNRRQTHFPLGSSSVVRGAMNTERRDAYDRAIRVVEHFKSIDRSLSSEDRAAVSEFHVLYFGGLLLVESPDVEEFMIDLGRPLGKKGMLATWIETGHKPGGFDALADKFLEVLYKGRTDLEAPQENEDVLRLGGPTVLPALDEQAAPLTASSPVGTSAGPTVPGG